MLTVTSNGSATTSVAAGTVVTLTATVMSGSTPVNPGQVNFCDASAKYCEDSALLATAQLTTAGIATFKVRPGGGSHSYQAVFVGTSSYAKSSSSTAPLIVIYPTTTAVTSSGSIGEYMLTATVVGSGSRTLSPTGDVSFLDTTDDNALLSTLTLGTPTFQNGFTLTTSSAVYSSTSWPPFSVALGDFNGDGIPDLVTTNPSGTGILTILLGNGDGTFAVKSSYAETEPSPPVVGDFNGDGIPDLAVANQGGSTVIILLGNGDGTFTSKSTLSVGMNPVSMGIGDFNGDGIPDLAVVNQGDGTVTILLGNGDGTFTASSTVDAESGNSPNAAVDFIAVGDFNSDGIPDLAIVNQVQNQVTVLLGNGDGTFMTKSTPGVGTNPYSIAVGDFNGDGIPDLATANATDGTVTVLLGNGDGTFTTKSTPDVGAYPVSIAVGDFNGDGISDFAVANLDAGTVTVMLGKGDGTFTTGPTPNAGAGGDPWSVAVGDLNGDGLPDIAVASPGYPVTVSALLNEATETETATLSNVSVPSSSGEAHQVEARYLGDTNFNSSTSTIVTLLAAHRVTTLTLSSSASTSIAGNAITLSATLNPYSLGSLTTNGETVTFYSNGVTIGSSILSSGVAALNVASLPGGANTLTAVYPGDADFDTATSNSISHTVATTVLQLSSSTNPLVSGNQVTLTATLAPYSSGSSTTNGETVTFINGETSIGTGTLSSGIATLSVTSLPVGYDTLTAIYTGDANFFGATSNSLVETVTTVSGTIPKFVVTTNTDATTGVPGNCTGNGSSSCSLRDALAASAVDGAGLITFSTTEFGAVQPASARMISLTNGTLNIPSNTTITGPTMGSGATLTNLVTVSGGGPVFTVNSGVTNAALSGLTITGGSAPFEGGGIFNSGALTVSNSTISGNSAAGYDVSGGGIENSGAMTLIDSTVTGNSVSIATAGCSNCFVQGGGIDNGGTLTLTNSTVVGNSASINLSGYDGSLTNIYATGGGINNYGTLTLNNSTVAGNSVNAQGVVNNGGLLVGLGGGGIEGGLTGVNNIISENANNGSEDDCDTYASPPQVCPANGTNGNVVGSNVTLAPLGNYGGPTQTQPPLPGSPAICAGVIADIPSGTTTDQRGFPRTTTYGSNPPCVDSGPVQTNYSLSFSTEPPATIPATTSFTAAVQVMESGTAFPVSGAGVPIALAAGDSGSVNVSSIATNASGIAANDQFQISTPGNDKLVATLPITAAQVTPEATANTTSTGINVTQSSGVQVTVGASPSGLTFMVDGVSYTATTTLVWPLGSQHTLSTVSPQGTAGTQYTFASWSDGGAITHTVTAATSTIDYTVTFNTTYLLTTSANPSNGGTVSPASGYVPANSLVPLTATANPGYAFTNWTGNVASTSSPTTNIAMSAPETVTANFTTTPIYTVNTNADDSTGTAANCSSGSTTPCSLRDALAAAAAATSGADIEFDPTIFAAGQPATARTIVLGSAGTLNVPDNTRVFGPTIGTGPALTQLITINGKNLSSTSIFSTGYNTVLSGLLITGDSEATAISNDNGLTVIDCTISGNGGSGITNSNGLTVIGTAISGNSSNDGGGGILNEGGSVTVIDSTISGNSASGTPLPGSNASGGGIYTLTGTVTIMNSTIAGNSGTGIAAFGGINQNISPPYVTIANSTISGNTGGAVNIEGGVDLNTSDYIPVTLSVTDSLLSGNTTNGSEDDCDDPSVGPYFNTDECPANGAAGNFVGPNALLAPLANYGGPTQTQPPLPGSPAICAGVIADIPSGITTDQRGFPRITTYGSNPPCVDSGSVQTSYTLGFSTEPPASVPPNVNFAAALQLSENGSPFPVSGVTIPIALATGDNGALNVSGLATNASGIAASSQLQVSAMGSTDTLVSTLPLTTTPPPAPLTSPITIGATSSTFNVGQTTQTITFTPIASPVTFGAGPIALAATSTSGLPVALSVTSGPGMVSGSTLTITGAGTVVVAASQVGNGDYTAAAPVSQTIVVNKAVSAIALTSSTLNPALDSPVTLTATVTSNAGTPTGNVQFFDGTTAIGMSALNAQGVAVYSTSALGTGKHSISATYVGDQNFNGSPSAAVEVSVAEQSQTIAFPALASPATYGAPPLALKATASSGLAVSYAVTGPAKITSATLTITGAGTVVVTASQAGNSTYSAATPVSQTIIVDKAASSTTVSSSGANANLGAALTFTATVNSTAGTPTGSVQFFDGATVLGTSPVNAQGAATYTTSTLTAGSHTINAVYSGDTNFAASQSTLTQAVIAPAFTLAADPATLTLKAGQTGQIKITLTPVGGYTGSLTFACGGLPAQSSCSFSPATLSADGSNAAVSTIMTITTAGSSSGTVTRLTPDTPGTGSAQTLLCWLPGGLLGLVLYWQRKRISPAAKRTLWMVLLVAAAFGAAACGTPGSKTPPPTQTTPAGNSTVTINASASGSNMQSLTISLTITQ